ncbi:MAG: choice-of-anchor R domain-containing protein [Candidatus Scalindua sp.]
MGTISISRSSITGASKALSNLANTAVNADIIPANDNAIDLGSASKQVKNIECKKVIYGLHAIEADTEDNDGVKIIQCFHAHTAGDGTAGNFCLHEGTEPPESVAAQAGHRLWVDASGVLRHQKPASGGAINLDAGGATSVREQVNIMLNAFRLNLAKFNLMDGMTDAFVSEVGIDVADSTNENYDAGNNLYNSSVAEAILEQNTTGSDEAHLGDASNNEFRNAQSFDVPSGGAEITKIKVTFGVTVGTPTGTVTAKIETDSSGLPSGTLAHVNLTKAITPTQSVENTFTFDTPATLGAGTYHLVIDCSDQSANKRWMIVYFSGGDPYAGGKKLVKTNGSWSSEPTSDMLFKVYSNQMQDMTLISEATEAEANPGEVRIVIFEEDVDAATLNTDLKAYVSRDDGANWVQATLADKGDYETGKRILTGTADVSGQAADKTIRYKIETLNSKDLNLHGVGLLWD